jgi:16S rRNA (guanine527-N7)-methyltransferase
MSAERTASPLAEIAQRYGLTNHQCGQLVSLLAAVERDEHAPTAVRDAARAADVHIADSLVALEVEEVRGAEIIADLGAGAGFPGLALAVALPRVEVRLVESQARKCAFMRGLVVQVGIENAKVVCTRVEDWEDGVGGHDLVTARAIAAQPVLLEYAAPLLRLGGLVVDWRGRRLQAEEDAALGAAGELGLRRLEIRGVQPFRAARDHHLHVFEKVAETPERFPRRAGMARKRPLGA